MNNTLEICYPELALEWNIDMNDGLLPSDVPATALASFFWNCNHCGQTYKSTITERLHGKRCTNCHHKPFLPGINDLFSVSPHTSLFWDSKKNILNPSEVYYFSQNIAHWICPVCKQEWTAPIVSQLHSGCPRCYKNLPKESKNDTSLLLKCFPHIASEFHPDKNTKIKLDTLASDYPKKVWWKCKNGHEWRMSPNRRVNLNNLCPVCADETRKEFPHVNLLLVYEWDFEKNEFNPYETKPFSAKRAYWKCERNHSWSALISNRTNFNGKCPYCKTEKKEEIYIDRKIHRQKILAKYRITNSIKNTHPELLAYWNTERNGSLRPDEITYGSRKKVWWKCDNGHEYQMEVKGKVGGYGCPYCSGNRRLNNQNLRFNLAKTHPELVKQWDYELNDKIPEEVYANSDYIAHWKCENGHSRTLSVRSRCQAKSTCVYCMRGYVNSQDSLANTAPNLLMIWDYKKNSVSPELLPHTSKRIVNWHCKDCGTSWRKAINIQHKINGCLHCKGYKDIFEKNHINISYDELLNDFDPSLNPNIDIKSVHPNSKKLLTWRCPDCNKTYKKNMYHRSKGSACPYCLGFYPSEDYNVAVCYPWLVKEWSNKNLPLKPTDFTPGSHTKVWWCCPEGHEYQAPISQRIRSIRRCPVCTGHRLVVGINDFASRYPSLALEWSSSNTIKPTEIKYNSDKNVLWYCKTCKTEYTRNIRTRKKDPACPACSGKIPIPGKTSFAAVVPDLMDEWDPENEVDPYRIFPRYALPVKWICRECGSRWSATVSERVKGFGLCPNVRLHDNFV